jgi:NTP pyrophosphatase (non-canonical NTP hydrolase)
MQKADIVPIGTLPPNAAHVLSHLARNAAMDAPAFTFAELAASMSARLREAAVHDGLYVLQQHGWVSILDGRIKLGLLPLRTVVDLEYQRFVGALFKCFYRAPTSEEVDAANGERAFVLDFNATLMHAMVGISGEAGELLDAAKKAWVYNKPLDRDNMVEELGDLFFYMVKAMDLLGVTLGDVVRQNQAKLLRRYPNGVYSDRDAQTRADKTIAS